MDTLHSADRWPAGGEPIAIVGIGCRFPGGIDSPDAYWDLLISGRDAIGEVPADRWDPYRAAGREHERALRRMNGFGGFLDDIEGFDAGFFGISPREAELMDPQQRVAMEVAWEALEHAGIVPGDLAGGDTAVYVGVNADDYGRRTLEDLPRIEAWTGIGASLCAVANRVSYALDLHGPSMVVDTACSSSLVAIDLACQDLRRGATPLAIAGGVMLMAGPGLTMVMDAAGALSADGRSKPFDAAADGYGRGEGCGIVILKRLADARRDGDRVYALIRGGSVNQDGRTNGIMAPSSDAQARLLRRACMRAGVSPAAVDYVEAHGTGTRAGDPVEATAMAAVFGAGRPADRPCLIGSVKSNIGHLEAASGVAGVIKTALALHHGRIPPSLNFTEPNPEIPWEKAGLEVVTAARDWPERDRPRLAGVSGYGYGGTIAHLVLEEADGPARPGSQTGDRPAGRRVYPLSGASPEAVREYAGRLADWMSGAGAAAALGDIGHTLARRRAHLTHRVGIVAADRAELTDRLRAVAEDLPAEGVASAAVLPAAADPVWVFSGHGSQWTGMGREMLTAEPVFADVLARLDPVFRAEIGFSPRRILFDDELRDTDRIQPMIFAMQVALAAVWRRYGLRPGAIIGHSVGEIAAAVTAGVLDLEDGARLVCRRSRLLRHVAGKGSMAMVNLPFEEVAERLAGRRDVVPAISASPTSTVVAGDFAAMETLIDRWDGDDSLFVRRVDSDVAFHSEHMDPLLDDLAAAMDDMTPRDPVVPLYTTALDDPRATPLRDGDYWAANLRNPVRFSESVRAAVDDGHRVFLEISSHPVVAHSIGETLSEALPEAGARDTAVLHTLRRNRPEQATLLVNLAGLHCHGVPIEWTAAQPDGDLAALPRVAWRHRRYSVPVVSRRDTSGPQHDVESHTLLGAPLTVNVASPIRLWQTDLDESTRPYPGDHPVLGTEIVPAAVILNTFFAAAGTPALGDVSLRVPISVAAAKTLQVVAADDGLRLSSRAVGDDAESGWLTHTTAVIAHSPDPVEPLRDIRSDRPLDPGFVIERLATVGVAAMGFPWRITELRHGDGTLSARVEAGGADGWAPMLDAALSTASVVFPGTPVLRMPAHIRQVVLDGPPPDEAVITVRVHHGTAALDTVDVDVATVSGAVVAWFRGLRYGMPDGDLGAPASPRRLVHEVAWRPVEQPRGETPPEPVVLLGTGDLAGTLHRALAAAGVPVTVVGDPAGLTAGPAAVLVTAPGGGSLEGTAVAGAWLLTRAAQVLTRMPDGRRPRLWCLTRGVREAATDGAVGQSPLWGVGRVLAGEHPEIWGGIIDLDPRDPAAGIPALLRLLTAPPGEDVVALRPDGPLASRLVPLESAEARTPVGCRPEGTYLVTGGLGTLGLEVAHWLAGRGARRLVLAGRAGLPPREQWAEVTDPVVRARVESVHALEAAGVTVRTLALDIADRREAARLLSPGELGLPPIRGVVHLAGVLDNRMARDVDEASLRAVMRPKVGGALTLHELFPPGSLDFFVLFASAGPLLGLPGQTSYAAANTFLDALALRRRADGGDETVSFDWTSWRGLGMSTSSEIIDAELAARGTADITAADAFRAWEFTERYDVAQVAVLRAIPLSPGLERPPLLREMSVPVQQATDPADDRTAPWAGLSGTELRDHLIAAVSRQIAMESRMPEEELDVRRPLAEMGFDSVMTLVIRRRLEKHFRTALPPTLLWNRQTVEAIADFLAGLLRPADGEAVEPEGVTA